MALQKSKSRLDTAILKLYTAFHSGELEPECCKKCAVGNILDNTDSWKHLSESHGSLQLNYVGRVHQSLGRRFNGYTPSELLQIEAIFLKACGYAVPLVTGGAVPKNPNDKSVLFQGLTAVVAYLCELEGVDNVMDYSRLFEYDRSPSDKQLEFLSLV